MAALRGAAQAMRTARRCVRRGRVGVELINAYARPLPLRAISDLLGVPVADYPQLERWLHDFKPALNFLPMSRDDLDACNAAVIGLRDYFIAMIEERRVRPGGDLLSAMISETDAGNISDVELATNAYVLYFAGHDTTADMIGNGMDMLAAHPDQLAELQANMPLFDGALVELLRVCAPGQANIRTMPEDIVLDGETVPAGCPIGFYFASANRDPKVWDDPDAFDIHRPPRPHLTFSSGPHVCPGRHLATATVDIGLRTLVRRLPVFRLGEPVEWSKAIQTRGPDRIVIEWQPPSG